MFHRTCTLWSMLVWVAAASIGCDDTLDLEPDSSVPELPAIAQCERAGEWTDTAIELEQALLDAIQVQRERGAVCGTRGRFAPEHPLQLSGALTCAARLHSLDMATRDYLAHTTPGGKLPWQRLREVGYRFATADEVLAAAPLTPQEVVDTLWMTRESNCARLLADYDEIGIGMAETPGDPEVNDGQVQRIWTVMLGRPL